LRFVHRFAVDAPLEVVAAFHQSTASMALITPPPIGVRLDEAPAVLGEGAEMAFTLQLGPLSVPWRARIGGVGQSGFVDHQIHGPFRRWQHWHSFRRLEAGRTEVSDIIEVDLQPHPLWGPLGLAMWLGLPLLFAYRAWRTRRLLERQR
jgi:ligand-binding SRPBCC domain-containing protein